MEGRPGFRESLGQLNEAWHAVQDSAVLLAVPTDAARSGEAALRRLSGVVLSAGGMSFKSKVARLRELSSGAAGEAQSHSKPTRQNSVHDVASELIQHERATAKRQVPKLQMAESLFDLFCEADELNDLLQAKSYELAVEHRGNFHPCQVKNEARALQKVFRTYGGHWQKLCDLCRASIVFDDIESMTGCLRAIAADPELETLRGSHSKMRLRESFDAAALTGGYRDIQLTVRLNSAESRRRKVHEHVAELQLHLAPLYNLKTGGGHKNYVMCRNLSGA